MLKSIGYIVSSMGNSWVINDSEFGEIITDAPHSTIPSIVRAIVTVYKERDRNIALNILTYIKLTNVPFEDVLYLLRNVPEFAPYKEEVEKLLLLI